MIPVRELQLQYMVCCRDREIADLRLLVLTEQLREASGASYAAAFNHELMTFTEPPPVDVPTPDAHPEEPDHA